MKGRVDPAPDVFRVLAEVKVERRRQVTDEGYGQDHDDDHVDGELAAAAAAYALYETAARNTFFSPLDAWPWEREQFKPKSRRENCIKAMALLCAEVERIDREAGKS